MVTQRFVTIGRINKSFGVNGEVLAQLRVKASFDELVGIEAWVIPPQLSWRNGKIRSIEVHGDGVKIAFEGLDSIEDAKPLAGSSIVVAREDVADELLDLDETEVSHAGYTVEDPLYGEVGTIVETLITGANDVWVTRGRYGEVLIPVIEDVVRVIDDESKHITVSLLSGLIESEPL